MYFLLLPLLFLVSILSLARGRVAYSTLESGIGMKPYPTVEGGLTIHQSCSKHEHDIIRSLGLVKALALAGRTEIKRPLALGVPDNPPTWFAYFFGFPSSNRRIILNVFDDILNVLNEGNGQANVEITCPKDCSNAIDDVIRKEYLDQTQIDLCPQAFVRDGPLIPIRCSYFLETSLGSKILLQMLLSQNIVHVNLFDEEQEFEFAAMRGRGEVFNSDGTATLDPAYVAANYIYMAQSVFKWKYIRRGQCRNWMKKENTWIKSRPVDIQSTHAGSGETTPIFAGGDRDELRRKLLDATEMDSGAGG
jgi:hypothetical protein